MTSHGPDLATWQAASAATLAPQKLDDTMAFMFESRLAYLPTQQALQMATLQADYHAAWAGFPKARL